jgi:hypothetical protein
MICACTFGGTPFDGVQLLGPDPPLKPVIVLQSADCC